MATKKPEPKKPSIPVMRPKAKPTPKPVPKKVAPPAPKPQVIPGQRKTDLESPELIQRYWRSFYKVHPIDVSRYTEEALNWFRIRVSKDLKVRADQIIKQQADYAVKAAAERSMVGKLYLFEYQAVQAGDEYTQAYDAYPLIFIFNIVNSKEGKKIMYGLNMHYLTSKERAIVFEGLMKLRSKKGITPATKLKLEWDMIKAVCKHPLIERAVHAYRLDRLKSRMIEIPATDWQVVLFLQIHQWKHIDGFDMHQGTAHALITGSYKRGKK